MRALVALRAYAVFRTLESDSRFAHWFVLPLAVRFDRCSDGNRALRASLGVRNMATARPVPGSGGGAALLVGGDRMAAGIRVSPSRGSDWCGHPRGHRVFQSLLGGRIPNNPSWPVGRRGAR